MIITKACDNYLFTSNQWYSYTGGNWRKSKRKLELN